MGWVRALDTFHSETDSGAPFAIAAGQVYDTDMPGIADMFARDPEGSAKLFVTLVTEETAPAAKKSSRAAKGSGT
jgi:hypothetical protein